MGHKIKVRSRIPEVLRVGYGMKISWRGRDSHISIGGMQDSFDIDSRIWDLQQSVLLDI